MHNVLHFRSNRGMNYKLCLPRIAESTFIIYTSYRYNVHIRILCYVVLITLLVSRKLNGQ